MCNESKTYYYADYNNTRISKVEMTKELLARTTPKIFVVKKVEDMAILSAEKVSPKEVAADLSDKAETGSTLLDMVGQEVLGGLKSAKQGTLDEDTQQTADQLLAELGQLKDKLGK